MIDRWKYSVYEGKHKVFMKHLHHFGSDYSGIHKCDVSMFKGSVDIRGSFCTNAFFKMAYSLSSVFKDTETRSILHFETL